MHLSFLKKIPQKQKDFPHLPTTILSSIFSYKLVVFATLFFVASLLFLSAPFQTLAQSLTPERRAQLEQELAQTEAEINAQKIILSDRQKQSVSLERDIAILNANISKSKLNIKAKDTQIAILNDDIGGKVKTIGSLSEKINRERESIAQLLRKSEQISSTSLPEVLFSGKNLSEFLVDVDAYSSIQVSLQNSTKIVKDARSDTEDQKLSLEGKRDKVIDLRKQQEVLKRSIEQQERDKQKILTQSRGLEKEYKKVLAEKEKRVGAIRAELFPLRDSGEIKFGQALDYANKVSAQTGIRPAFLLAIFMQESSFGKNQGSCLLKDGSTGSGISKRTGNSIARIMKPDRDVVPFLRITAAVGRDPYNTLVSCPQEVGWGGAMGAAQFIPSTWVLYEARLESALGVKAADPWRPSDAFMAAGLYLADLGAGSQSYSNERNAACRYFSGSKCANSTWATTYGDQVMKKAASIQETMINPIENR